MYEDAKYLWLIIFSVILAGCVVKEREVSFSSDRLDAIFSIEDLSEKWKLDSSTELFWEGGSGYEISFLQSTQSVPSYLGSSFSLVAFSDVNNAIQAFENYQSAFFGDIWRKNEDIQEPGVTFRDSRATRFRLSCDPVGINDSWDGVDHCMYWAQYENCIVIFGSHVQPPKVAYSEYLSNLELIDTRITNDKSKLCYNVNE